MGTLWLERSIVCLMSHSWLMVMAGPLADHSWEEVGLSYRAISGSGERLRVVSLPRATDRCVSCLDPG